jgi:hypothetical protein
MHGSMRGGWRGGEPTARRPGHRRETAGKRAPAWRRTTGPVAYSTDPGCIPYSRRNTRQTPLGAWRGRRAGGHAPGGGRLARRDRPCASAALHERRRLDAPADDPLGLVAVLLAPGEAVAADLDGVPILGEPKPTGRRIPYSKSTRRRNTIRTPGPRTSCRPWDPCPALFRSCRDSSDGTSERTWLEPLHHVVLGWS